MFFTSLSICLTVKNLRRFYKKRSVRWSYPDDEVISIYYLQIPV